MRGSRWRVRRANCKGRNGRIWTGARTGATGMNLVTLSASYLRARPLNTALNVLLLALGIATITLLMLAVVAQCFR